MRPSPDAVEYGLGAADLAGGRSPRVEIGGVVAPSRYPFGYPLLAAPLVRLAAGTGAPQPEAAVLASALAGAVLVGAIALTGWRTFGGACGPGGVRSAGRRASALGGGRGVGPQAGWPGGAAAVALGGALLTLVSPFYGTYVRLVMAELPAAALFALLALGLVSLAARREAAGARGASKAWLPLLLGLVLAAAVTVRLSALHALPAAVLALAVATPGGRRRALLLFGAGLGAGLLPLLLAQWSTFGSPLRTGYHLWTPEWAGGAGGQSAQFALEYALRRPALPAGAREPNLLHYGAAWLGLPAAGDGGQKVGSPVHATAAGVLAVGAVLGTVRAARAGRIGQTLAVFVAGGLLGALLCYGAYYFQDVRYLGPWIPLWLLLSAAGWLWPVWRWFPLAGGALLLLALASLPRTVEGAPAWQQGVRGRPAPPPPRLAQLRSLRDDLPPEAWIVSALDGPLLEHHVLRGTERRYVPLSKGLEFVDKPPFSRLRGAPELRADLLARARQRPGTVVIDRWSLEFAEGLPDFRRELLLTLEGAGLAPGGGGAPRDPAYYALVPGAPERGAGGFALREGEALRDSGGRVYVYGAGVRRHVPDVARLRALGLRWEDVRRVPDLVLEALPEGPPLPAGGD